MSTENASALAEGQALPAAEQQNVTGTENPEQQQEERRFSQAELDEKVQRRVAKEARKAEARYAALEAQIAELKQPKPAESATSEKEPKRADFESYEAFVEARAEWRADQKVSKALDQFRNEGKQKEEKSRQEESHKAFQKRVEGIVEKGNEKYPDFDAVVNEAVEDGLIPLDSAMYQGLIDSDMGHELAYYLAKNPAEAKRILAMGPYGQARELGKLEDKLSAKKEQPREGMETISGRNQSPSGLSDNQSMDAWIKARNKQLRERGS